MTDAELRSLVRDAVQRHLGHRAVPADLPPDGMPVQAADPPWLQHASHFQYVTLVNIGEACLIEPNVECTHCGYCKSHGH